MTWENEDKVWAEAEVRNHNLTHTDLMKGLIIGYF